MNLAATDVLYIDSGGRYMNPQNCAKLTTPTGIQVKRGVPNKFGGRSRCGNPGGGLVRWVCHVIPSLGRSWTQGLRSRALRPTGYSHFILGAPVFKMSLERDTEPSVYPAAQGAVICLLGSG